MARNVGPLHFAGEYVDAAYMGTTHGAAVTGMKACADIMAMLGLGRARLAFQEAALTTSPSRSKAKRTGTPEGVSTTGGGSSSSSSSGGGSAAEVGDHQEALASIRAKL